MTNSKVPARPSSTRVGNAVAGRVRDETDGLTVGDAGSSSQAGAGPRPQIVEAIAQRIAAGRRDNVSVEMLPEELYPRWEEIYPVHDRVHELLGRPSVGWKVGAASAEVREAEGMPEPVAGRIYARGLHADGAVLGADLFIGYRLCESEFVLTLGDDLPGGSDPVTREIVEPRIATVRPCLEVGDMVFPDWYGTNPFWGACLDNVGGSQLVLGPATEYHPSLDLAHSPMSLTCNGRVVRRGDGSAAMGDPVESAVWLVNVGRQRGHAMPAGTLLSTGTCTGHYFAEPGDRMMADFGRLHRVSLEFAAAERL